MVKKQGISIQQKLLYAGGFLAITAMVVGSEGTPSFLTIAQKKGEQHLEEKTAQQVALNEPKAEPAPVQETAPDSWYAEVSSPDAKTAPKPVNLEEVTIGESTVGKSSATGSTPRAQNNSGFGNFDTGTDDNANHISQSEFENDSEWETIR
jgi:hypothetical protein